MCTEQNFSKPVFTLSWFFSAHLYDFIFFPTFTSMYTCQMNCMHRRRCNKRAGVSAALCVPKRQRKNIIWRFLWHRALRAAIDPIPILYMELLTKGHVREWLRTGEAMAKVNIDSVFPWCGCLCRIHRSVVQPERRLNELMDERTLSELLNTQKISLARDVPGLQVLCTGEEGRGCL